MPALVAAALAVSACGDGASEAAQRETGPSGEVAASAVGSCVETYDLQTLTGRDFAFDGTAVEIGSPLTGEDGPGYSPVTFEVHEWYRGGESARVTVAVPPPEQVSSEGLQGQYETYGVDTRLLLSGEPQWGGEPLDDPVAWMCGFTRYYDEDTAAQWRAALTP
jgi:hypothetical protein